MTQAVKPRKASSKVVLSTLSDVLDSLPSLEDRERVRESCHTLMDFLHQIVDVIDAMPSPENAEAARKSLAHLSELYDRAKSDPTLSLALPGAQRRTKGTSKVSVSPEELEQAGEKVALLEKVPFDKLHQHLADDKLYSVRQLRAMAATFGLRPNSKQTRRNLVQNIATKVINARGYRDLRGE